MTATLRCIVKLFICALIAIWFAACAKMPNIPTHLARDRYPDADWLQYATPEEAGWSSTQLERARKYADAIGSSAVMVIDNGAVVAAWGDVTKRYRCHSIRKSVLSALYGIHVHNGDIDLHKTLAELNIDDSPPSLTAEEKQARVIDLLRSRSGVYHTAAYESAWAKALRPDRGRYAPGEYFYYNNWDFNTLMTIFEQETGDKIFDVFHRRIAGPVQMQDFRRRDGYYRLESEHSRHPAYPMRLSTRDLARFGLLFLRQGKWQGQQIVPAAWVEESTRSHSRTSLRSDYGYMWWVANRPFKRYGKYAARGSGGHELSICPKLDVVVVHRVDTWRGHRVQRYARNKLLRLIIQARTAASKTAPKLRLLAAQPTRERGITLPLETLQMYARDYRFESGTVVRITVEDGALVAYTRWGTYGLIPLSPTEFLIEDRGTPLWFEFDASGQPTRPIFPILLIHLGHFHLRQGQMDKAIEWFQRGVDYFPNSSLTHRYLGLGYQRNGDEALAIKHYQKALKLNPRSYRAERALQRLQSQ